MKVQSLKEVILGNKKDLMGVAIILLMCYHIELGGIIDNIRPLQEEGVQVIAFISDCLQCLVCFLVAKRWWQYRTILLESGVS